MECPNNTRLSSCCCSSSACAIMASAIYILNDKGGQLVGRDFRGDLPPRVIEKFIERVRDEEEQHSLKVPSTRLATRAERCALHGKGFFSRFARFMGLRFDWRHRMCVVRYRAG